MAGIRTLPTPSKYVVDRQYANGEKFFSGHFNYEMLLEAAGGTYTDYTMLKEYAKSFYMESSRTLSKNTAPFMEWVKGTSPTKDVRNRYVRWRHYGEPKRKFISLGNAQPDCEYIGAAGAKFQFRTDVNHFQPSDQLAPTENARAIIVIESYPRAIAGGFEYEATLLDPNTYLPDFYLNSGVMWCRAGQAASYNTPITGQAGTFSFNESFAYVELQVPLHTMTKEYSVDMETHLKEGSLMVGCKYDDKTIEGRITNRIAEEFDASFEREMEYLLLYGQMTDNRVDPITRKPITTAPGLYDFLEESNIIDYNPFTNSLDMIVDLVKSYWFDRVPVSQRNLVLMTGEAGLELWNKWITDKFGSMPVQVSENFVLKKTKSFDPDKQGYALGNFQFTTYQIPTFGKVSVAHWPVLDDTLHSSRRMPGSIYTIKSHEFIAMDWGAGSPNISLLRNTQRDRDIVINGFWTPYGPTGMKNPVFKSIGDPNLGDSYLVRKSRTFGLAIENLENILLFRPAV